MPEVIWPVGRRPQDIWAVCKYRRSAVMRLNQPRQVQAERQRLPHPSFFQGCTVPIEDQDAQLRQRLTEVPALWN